MKPRGRPYRLDFYELAVILSVLGLIGIVLLACRVYLAIAFPLLLGAVATGAFVLRHRTAVSWADRQGVELLTVSPRFFRCGPYFFTELAVTRVSVMAKGHQRHVWLVTYRDRWFPWHEGNPFKSWGDVTAHWDDVEPTK